MVAIFWKIRKRGMILMKIERRIKQAIEYNVKKIIISKDTYKDLDKETRELLKINKIKLIFEEKQKGLVCKFEEKRRNE